MLEVSADVAEDVARAQKTSRKHTPSKRTKKASREGGPHVQATSKEHARSKRTRKASPVGIPQQTPAALAPTSAIAQTPPRASGTTGSAMVLMAVVGVLVVAALALALRPSPRAVSAALNTQPAALAPPVHVAAAVPDTLPAPTAAPVPVAAVARARVPRAFAERPNQTPVSTTTRPPADSVPSPPPAVGAAAGGDESAAQTVAPESTTSASAVASTAPPDATSQVPVTITGCLETTVDEVQFRLTDTEGADAPKARSWRSGFLKKRSTPVELVELSDPVGMRKYVGRRVVATGLLTSRELRVRSLQSAGSSCN
jgi:hypothetical protein